MRVQTNVADPGVHSAIALPRLIANDLDFLAARLHARRSRMAEAERLDGLCRIQSLSEFFRTIFPYSEIKGSLDFQRQLVNELIGEISGFHTYMAAPGIDLLDWMLVRFQVENVKILLRACLTKTPIEDPDSILVSLPRELVLKYEGLAAAESMEDFVRRAPNGFFQDNLEHALKIYREYPRPFFFEASLDKAYFHVLVDRTEKLSSEDREIVRPMVQQEVDIFHLMLVARGKFHYNLTPEMLRPLRVPGTRIPRALFADMLNDPDIPSLAGRVAGRVLDTASFEHGLNDGPMALNASVLEGLAWKQFFLLSGRAFRQSHMGLGAIIGYTGLRRVETANLITISEGIRNGMAPEAIRIRLIPRSNVEAAHV